MSNAHPEIGKPAPDFTLPSTSGAEFTLADARGKSVLLAFFPLAFTGVCTEEFCDISAGLGDFEELNVMVLGVSVDSAPTLSEFKKKNSLAIDLLSDFKRDVCRLYGTLMDQHFFSSRSYFLIDPGGILRWAHTTENPGVKLDNDRILAEMAKLG